MLELVFQFKSGGSLERLVVNDNGTATWSIENIGWRGDRYGGRPKERTMSVEAARSRWPDYNKEIDEALAKLAARRNSN